MEGPTPVSALIHAATMVTAGIFLMIRCSFIFECSENIRLLIIVFGVCTAFTAALTACTLYDLKKIIAYSTCSQLGYMFLAGGLAQYGTSFFHLLNHAFFKALLFLCAGAVIHSFGNEQDIRKLFIVGVRSKLLYVGFLVGNIAIMGLPFLSGFYSKDLIIESLLTSYGFVGFPQAASVLSLLVFMATGCTAYYSCRIMYFLFFRQGAVGFIFGPSFFIYQPALIGFVLSSLVCGSIFAGYVLSDFFTVGSLLNGGQNLWSKALL